MKFTNTAGKERQCEILEGSFHDSFTPNPYEVSEIVQMPMTIRQCARKLYADLFGADESDEDLSDGDDNNSDDYEADDLPAACLLAA